MLALQRRPLLCFHSQLAPIRRPPIVAVNGVQEATCGVAKGTNLPCGALWFSGAV
jgi:hypothetical protein